MRLHYLILAALAAVAVTPAPAFERPRARVKQQMEEIFRDAPLSPEQREKIRAVIGARRAEIRDVWKKTEGARHALADASKTGDAAAVQRAADQVGEAARNRALLRARIEGEIRPILTPQQIKCLEAARSKLWTRADAVASGSNS